MPVSQRKAAERQARRDARLAEAVIVIPQGPYCYSGHGPVRMIEIEGRMQPAMARLNVCPYQKLRSDKPEHRNGYCRFLKAGDYSQGSHRTMLLWDSVKECGINDAEEDQGNDD